MPDNTRTDEPPETARSARSDSPADWRLVEPTPDLRGIRALHQGLLEIDGLVSNTAGEVHRSFAGQRSVLDDTRAAVAEHGKKLDAFRDEVALMAVQIAAAQAAQAKRLTTACELLEAGFRDARSDIREAKDDARAAAEIAEREGQQRAGDFAALASHLAPTEAHAARVPELAMRLGSVEGALGEEPDPAAEPPKHGSGLRGRVSTLWSDLGQRKASTGVAALAGGGGAIALLQLVKLIAELLHG
jgi:hypothetical protein